MLLRTLQFSVYYLCHSEFFAFNWLRTLSEKHGGGMGFFPLWYSTRATLCRFPALRRLALSVAEGSLAAGHRLALSAAEGSLSFISLLECAVPKAASVTPLECAVPKNLGRGAYFSPHPEGDADPEKCSAEGPLEFCL